MAIAGKIRNRLFIELKLTSLLLKITKNNPVILMYHGVSKNSDLAHNSKHLDYQLFKKQLILLSNYYEFVSVDDLIEDITTGQPNFPKIAITFDDGYKNNSEIAADILSDLGLTATFYLSTGYIGTDRWMWTDLLEYSLLNTCKDYLDTALSDKPLALSSPNERRSVLSRLKFILKSEKSAESESIVKKIAQQLLNDPKILPFGDYCFMNWSDVKSLDSAGFTIGAHTVNHPILSRINTNDAKKEIVTSKNTIIEKVGKCSSVFCYPNGKKADYDSELMNITRKYFKAAVSTKYGYARGDELFELRRIGVDNSLGDSLLLKRIMNQTTGAV